MATPRALIVGGALLCGGLLVTSLAACSAPRDDAAGPGTSGELAVPTPGEVLDPVGASVAPDGSRVAVPCHEEWVCLWRSDDLTGVLPGATATAWLPRGEDALLVTATAPEDGSPGLLVRDPDTGRQAARLDTAAPVSALVTSEDGSTLAAASGDRVLVLDAVDLEIRADLPVPGAPLDLALAPDGARLLVVVEGGAPQVVDARTGRALGTLGEPPAQQAEQVRAVAWSPRGDRVATGSESRVRVWNPETGAVSAERSVPAPLGAIDYGAEELRLALTAGEGQALVLWNGVGEGAQVLDEYADRPAERVLWSAGTPSWLRTVTTTQVRLFDLDIPTEQAVDDPPFPEELPQLDLRTTR